MWNKETPEAMRNIEYLKRASPETVYQWFESQTRPELFKSYRPERYEGLENELLKRNDGLIDLSLARWSQDCETRKHLFSKYCCDENGVANIAKRGSFEETILVNMLSNENLSYHYSDWRLIDFCDDDFIVKLIDKNESIIYFNAIHYNAAIGIKSLVFLSSNSGVYSSLSDDLWVGVVARLADNEAIRKIEDFKYNLDSMERLKVIQAVLSVCLMSPRTKDSLDACVRLLENFQNWFTVSELDNLLVQAVEYWDDESLSSVPNLASFDIGSDWDGMRANERLQFHLWRVAGRVGFDVNDPRKHVRLAAYAINGISEYDIKHNLKLEDIVSYSKRDGAAFMYANSYNGCIWSLASRHSEFRKKVLDIKFESGVTYPRNPTLVHEIRGVTSKSDESPESNRQYLKLYSDDDSNENILRNLIIENFTNRINSIDLLIRRSTVLTFILIAFLSLIFVMF